MVGLGPNPVTNPEQQNSNVAAEKNPEADSIEETMGKMLDQVNQETAFPLAKAGDKPSTTLTYSIAAQLSVEIQTKWTLFEGFDLTNVKLEVAVSKRKGNRGKSIDPAVDCNRLLPEAAMKVRLEAHLQVGETTVKVVGLIPRLGSGKDIDFVLSISALYPIESIPLGGLLSASAGKTVSPDNIRNSLDSAISNQIFDSTGVGFAAAASITVTRLAASKTYQVKAFQVHVQGAFDWDLIPNKVKLQNAALAVVAQRKKPTEGLNWSLALNGSIWVAQSATMNLTGAFLIENGVCTKLNARVEVGSLSGLTINSVMDTFAGEGASSNALKQYSAPPSLSFPTDTSKPLVLETRFVNNQGGWALDYLEASLLLQNINWTPIDFFTLQSLMLSLKAMRQTPKSINDQQTLNPVSTSLGALVFSGSLRGSMTIADMPLTAEIVYNQEQSLLTIHAFLGDGIVCSLQNLYLGILDITATTTPSSDSSESSDFESITETSRLPSQCPIDTDWALHGSFGSQRQCTISIKDSKITSVSLAVVYEAPECVWKLTENLSIIDLGLWFTSTSSATDLPITKDISAFAFGRLAFSPSVTLYGFIAANVNDASKNFEVGLSIFKQPHSPLGIPLKEILNQKALGGATVDIDNWNLPSTFPKNATVEQAAQSLEASAKVAFASSSNVPTSTMIMTSISATMLAKGSWDLILGLQLKDAALSIIAKRENVSNTASFQTKVALYGRMQIAVNQNTFDLWCLATLDKTKSTSTEFQAVVTACASNSCTYPPPISQLNPSQLTGLEVFGNFPLSMAPNQKLPPNSPIQPETLASSLLASCQITVSKVENVEGWLLSHLGFRLSTEQSWDILPSKISLSRISLHLDIASPKDQAKRAFVASLSAYVVLGMSTNFSATLKFSSPSANKYVLAGDLVQSNQSAIDIVKVANELVPNTSGPVVPLSTANLNVPLGVAIKFWLDVTQPTLLLYGTIPNIGSLLYFLHRPDPMQNTYVWMISLSITSISQLFPWLDPSVTQAFDLEQFGVEIIGQKLSVQQLIAYINLSQTPSAVGVLSTSRVSLIQAFSLDTTLDMGAWIFASVKLSGTSGGMSTTLQLAVEENSSPQIVFSGNVRDQVKNMDCSLSLKNFLIFGGSIELNGAVVYSPSTSQIKGTVSLILKDLSSTTMPSFTVELLMTKQQTKFDFIVGQQAQPIQNPFDKMYNVQLLVAKISGSINAAKDSLSPRTSEYEVTGSLQWGSPQWLTSASAKLIFINGKARILVCSVEKIDINEIYGKLVKPNPGSQQSGSWPSEYPVLSFSSASVYYAKPAKPDELEVIYSGIHYQTGFCMAASFQFFGKPFTVTVTLPGNRSGLRIDGSYDQEIDLLFAQLVGYTYKGTSLPSPSLILDTTNNPKIYTATSGLKIFGLEGLKIDLSYIPTTSKTCFEGTKWPFQRPGEDAGADFLQNAIQKASTTYGCGECKDLVGLVFDNVVKTGFKFSLGLPKNGKPQVTDKTYIGAIDWSYDISVEVLGKTIPVTSVDMDPIDIAIPKPFQTSSIWSALLDFLTTNVVQIGEALLRQPGKLAQILGYMTLEKCTEEALASLLCRGAKSDSVKKEASNRVNKKQKESDTNTSKTESSGKSVGAAGSIGDAIAAFGAAAAGLAAETALDVVLGAGATLAGFLLGALGLGGDHDEVTAAQKQHVENKERCKKAVEDTRQILQSTIKLSGPASAKWSKDTTTEATIEVDWSKSLPTPPSEALSGYFGDLKNFSWDIAYQFQDKLEGLKVVPVATSATYTWPLSDSAFLTHTSIFVWVRSKISSGSETIISSWSPVTQLTHILYLPTPTAVTLSVGSPSFDQIVVNTPSAKSGTFELTITPAESDPTTNPYFQMQFGDGRSVTNIPLSSLSVKEGENRSIKANVRQLSKDQTKFQNSPWAASSENLPVEWDSLDLKLSQAGQNIVLEWNSSSYALDSFKWLAWKADGLDISELVVADYHVFPTRIQITLSSQAFVPDATYTFAMRRSASTGSPVRFFTKQNISLQPVITAAITDSSFFDLSTSQLRLVLKTNVSLTMDQKIMVTLYWLGSSQQVDTKIYSQDNSASTAELADISITSPMPTDVKATLIAVSGATSAVTNQWAFPSPDLVSNPPMINYFQVDFNGTAAIVSWATSSNVMLCSISLWDGDDSVTSQRFPGFADCNQGTYSAKFSGNDLDHLKVVGQSKFKIWSQVPKLRTVSKAWDYWLPDLTDWSKPAQAKNTTKVAQRGHLSSGSRDPDATAALWWMNDSCDSIQGNVNIKASKNWESTQTMMNPAPSSLIPSGSVIASCSRSAEHKEVFWILADGRIQGKWWKSGTEKQGTDYKFETPSTASTVLGGSMCALSCNPNTMDLWWVAPDGSIKNSHWNGDKGQGWGTPTTIEPAGTAAVSETAISMLTVCKSDGKAAELFWVTPALMIENRRCEDTDASQPVYISKAVTYSPDSMPVANAAVHALYSELLGTMVIWATSTGSVIMKSCDLRADDPKNRTWMGATTIAPPGLASPLTRICSSDWSEGTNQPVIMWISPDNTLRICKRAAVYTTKTHIDYPGYWSSSRYPGQISLRTNNLVGSRMELATTFIKKNTLQLFWIGEDGSVWFIGCPLPS